MNNEIKSPTTFTQVLVMGNYIDIQWIPARLMTEAYGESDHESREIRLRDNLRGLQALDTTLHELTHQISDLLKLDLTEAQVHGLGLAWSNVFAANPGLTAFIEDRVEEEAQRRAQDPRLYKMFEKVSVNKRTQKG
jgi:hypothetical protein